MESSGRRKARIAVVLAAIIGFVTAGILGVVALNNKDRAWRSEGFKSHSWDCGGQYGEGRGVWGDGTGNIYTCGIYNDDMGKYNLILVKWDGDGNVEWNRTWDDPSSSQGTAVWGDGAGNIYTCGEVDNDLLLVKWDTAGNVNWSRIWGGSAWDGANSLWGDSSGHIYVCGFIDGHAYPLYYHDMALYKWDSDGNMEWNITWGGSGDDYGTGIWGDGVGNLYTCGFTDSIGISDSDVFLAKWDDAGNKLWLHTWSGDNVEVGDCVWGDGVGNIFVSGTLAYSAYYIDALLMKWDTSGTLLWTRTWDSTFIEHRSVVWGDGAGSIYTSGFLFLFNDYRMFLTKWNSYGTLIWDRVWNDGFQTLGYGIWGDGSGAIYATGIPALFKIDLSAIEQVEVVLIVSEVVLIAAVALVSILLLVKLRASLPKKVVEPGVVPIWRRHANQEEQPYPGSAQPSQDQSAQLADSSVPPPGISCPRCGNLLPVCTEKEKYCVYCGEALHRE